VEFFSFDAEYLRRLEAQDPATENHFVGYFTDRLLRLKFYSRLVPRDHVDDLVNETLRRAFVAVRAGNVIRHPERLGAFVSRIGDNVHSEFIRDEIRHRHEDLDGIEIPGRVPGPEEFLKQKELKRTMAEVVRDMSPRNRQILRAVFWEEADKDEICVRFNVNREHLRLIIHRAIKKARKLWDAHNGHHGMDDGGKSNDNDGGEN
jgi:RNA polymerase sigma factor (sigma-70 family)